VNYKKTEAILYNYKKIKIEIKNLTLDLEVLENDYEGVRAISYDERSTPTNKFNSDVENEIIKRDEEKIKLRNKIRLKEIEIEKVDNIIEELDERDSYLIKEYYINHNQLKHICSKVNLDENYLSYYKTKLINEISNIMFIKEIS
jgi:DNA-directed RNA polymerase specialized sigma subunit